MSEYIRFLRRVRNASLGGVKIQKDKKRDDYDESRIH